MLTSNLISGKITEDLKKRLLANYVKSDSNVFTLYVSANGDDTTGDGTQERPFQTVKRACQETASINAYNRIDIEPLTDITEGGFALPSLKKIRFNTSQKHTITFTQNVGLTSCISIEFYKCVFEGGIDLTFGSVVNFNNCTFDGDNSYGVCLRVRYNSSASLFYTNTIKSTSDKSVIGVSAYCDSYILLSGDQINLDGAFTSFIRIDDNSAIGIGASTKINSLGNLSGTQYVLLDACISNIKSRGGGSLSI